MSIEIRDILMLECQLNENLKDILIKSMRKLSRQERRIFFEEVSPKLKLIKYTLNRLYNDLEEEERNKWIDFTIESMLLRGGNPDLIDTWVMDVVGNLFIYTKMRQRSEERGIRLTSLVNFGGLSMVLVLVVILSGIIIYFINT